MKSEVRKKKKCIQETNCSLAFCAAAARIEKGEDQLRRTTRDLRTRVATCSEVDGGILGHLSRTVTNSSFLCNIFFI